MKKILVLLLSPFYINADQNLHRYMWANYRQFGGQHQQAHQWYDEIFQSEKSSVFSNKGYLNLLDNNKNYKRIVELIPKLDTNFKKDPEVQLIFVNALRKTNNHTAADSRLFNLNKEFKNHPEIVFHTGEAYLRRKEFKNGISLIDDYLNQAPQRPNNFIFYFMKSQAYAQLNDYKKAHENIKLCLEAHPKFPQGWLLLALIEEQAGKIGQAISGYTSYLEIAGGNKQIEQHLLGLVLKQKAIGQNRQVIMLNRSCFEKAVILFERKDYRGALRQIDQCLTQSPLDAKARLLKVEILTALKEYNQVIQLLTQWATESSQPQVWLQALHLLTRVSQAPRSSIIAAFEKIHHHQQALLLPALFLADLYTREKKPDNALLYHQKALPLAKHPELKTRILYQIAIIQYEKQQLPQMHQTLEQAMNFNTDYPPALNLLAYYYATETKDIKKAESLIERALKKDKNNPHFLDTKAVVLYKQKKYKEALALLKPIAKKAPNDSTVLIHLAKTYHRLGDYNNACAVLGDAQKCAITSYEKQTTTALAHQWKP